VNNKSQIALPPGTNCSTSHCSLFTYFQAWNILFPETKTLNKTIVFTTSPDEMVCSVAWYVVEGRRQAS
jgi:hypothetical protein